MKTAMMTMAAMTKRKRKKMRLELLMTRSTRDCKIAPYSNISHFTIPYADDAILDEIDRC